MTRSALDFDIAIKDPSRQFDEPLHVVDHPGLDYQQKRRILRQWELDAKLLSTAEFEGMSGGEENKLRRVKLALKRLSRLAPLDMPRQRAR
jgi:hypothetical protein